jgi:ribose transport system permease protein
MTLAPGDEPVSEARPVMAPVGLVERVRAILTRRPTLFGMPALLIAFLAFTVAIHRNFDSFDSQSLAMAALPLAFAAAAQALIVISGGIDLSIGSVMAVSNVLAARTMENAGFGESLGLSVLILCAGALVGAINGLLVVVSRVPDVIVTLSTGFIWGGVALLILEKPGGGAPDEFLALGTGTLFTPWLSNSLILLVASLAIVWIPLRRSKVGLRLYAVGSDRTAAFRSGVNVAQSRFLAYVFGGLFSSVGGLGLTMTTGIGSPRSGVLYTLSGVAAVVIGGVSLIGGRGGIFGPVVAAFVLTLIPADLIYLNIDPNFGQVIQGTLIVIVVMLGGFFTLSRTAQTSGPVKASGLRSLLGSEKLLYWLQRNTFVVLVLLLVAFVAGVEIAKPGTVNSVWLSNTLLFAAPLGILAAGQTLVMLTGGIDLSVVSVATGSAFLMTTLTLRIGDGWSVVVGIALGVVVGLINGVGVAVLRVQPLVMTLGTGLMTQGVIIVYSQRILASRSVVPDFIHVLGSGRLGEIIPIDLFVWAPIAAAVIFGLRWSGFGRLVYAVGDNPEACQLAGVRVWRVLLVDYALCGLLAAIAGMLLVGNTNSADLGLADSYLLPSVAAVIIGGTSIFGGRGGYAGTIIGALILTVLNGLLTLVDSPEPVKQILYGGIIFGLAAVYTRLTE